MYKATITITTEKALEETATIQVKFDPPLQTKSGLTTVEVIATLALCAVANRAKNADPA